MSWIETRSGVDHDVAIIGGGQSGVTTAHALLRAGVTRVSVIDAGSDESESAWRTRARMRTLRTAKSISGPELGDPTLAFPAWFDNTYGADTFADIERIATLDWADYLSWFRKQAGVDVRHGVRVTDIAPAPAGLRLTMRSDGRQWTELTRKLVLATGVNGTGGPYIPVVLRDLPPVLWAHTAGEIDFSALRHKSVAVLGAAASAYDAAATALEAGAAEVHVYTRRPAVVIANPAHRPNPLAQDVFHLRPDDQRWRQRRQAAVAGASVPAEAVTRAAAFENYHLHVSAPWNAATERGGRVVVAAADGTRTFDYVIAGTGYQQDPGTRPELATVAPHIARWCDVYTPPDGLDDETLGVAPYLGADYELTERQPASATWLSDIHVFSIGANVSFGRPVGDIPSLRSGIPHLTRAITRDLVLADLAAAEAVRR